MSARRWLRAAALALTMALPLGTGGCATTVDATGIGVPVELASTAGQEVQGRRFEVTTRAIYGAWGLLQLREPDLEGALAGQLVGGERLTNVRIRVRSRWTDVLITGLTLGIIVPRAVTYEGVVVGQ